MSNDPKLLAAQAQSLKAQGRLHEAITLYEAAVASAPGSAAAEHNLAAALGDAGRWAEAEEHMRAAFAKGAKAPESWLVLARCLQAGGRFEEAEHAFRKALELRPAFGDAHFDLAQLLWMRTGDPLRAINSVDQALAAQPDDVALALVRARIIENTRGAAAARGDAEDLTRRHPLNLPVTVYASQIAAQCGAPDAALSHAQRASSFAPQDNVVAVTLTSALLGAGEAARAALEAEALLRRAPEDQHAIALLATAWRILGDPRYAALHDYDGLVRTSYLDTPHGWRNLEAYVADLARALRHAHQAVSHPFNQSIRHGSQVPDILGIDDPAIAVLPSALAPSIARYVADIGKGDDPLRRRNRGGYAFQGVWSIRMQAGGYHLDHVHPKGWISSACYIETPPTGVGAEGWIRFGAPGIATSPRLEAERYVEPKPGMLVLFPSYMWHGVIPYASPATRMTFAFDLEPAVLSAAAPAGNNRARDQALP